MYGSGGLLVISLKCPFIWELSLLCAYAFHFITNSENLLCIFVSKERATNSEYAPVVSSRMNLLRFNLQKSSSHIYFNNSVYYLLHFAYLCNRFNDASKSFCLRQMNTLEFNISIFNETSTKHYLFSVSFGAKLTSSIYFDSFFLVISPNSFADCLSITRSLIDQLPQLSLLYLPIHLFIFDENWSVISEAKQWFFFLFSLKFIHEFFMINEFSESVAQ